MGLCTPRARGAGHLLMLWSFMNEADSIRRELTSLRMVVAIDSAMTLSVLRLLKDDQLARVSVDFLEVCEGLSISALFSELDDHSIHASQKRRDWWIALVAELVSSRAIPPEP